MKDHTLRRVFVFFVAIFGVLAVVAVFAVRTVNRSEASNDWVNHTHEVISHIESVLSSLREGEGAMRTYLLTGDRRDLAAARDAFATMAEEVELAKALTRQEPATHEQVLRIETLANERSAFAEQVSAARAESRMADVQQMIAADPGLEALGEIRRGVEKLKAEQMELLRGRDRESYLQAQRMRWIVGTGVAFNFILLGAVTWLIRDDLAARRRAAEALRQANELLDAKVRERTAELAASNEQLVTENLERRWMNQALEHQLRYNQLIVDSVHDVVFVLTRAMNITRINPAVVHLTEWQPTDLLGQPLSKVLELPSTVEAAMHPIAQSLREGREMRGVAAVVHGRRGQKIPTQFTLFPLRDRDKVVGGILIVQASGAKAANS